MQFISEVPGLVLNEESGNQQTFCADVFRPRPSFRDMQKAAHWAVLQQEAMEEAMQRAKCPVAWAALYVDDTGMLALFHFKHRLMLNDAKRGAKTVLQQFPEEQRRAVELGLRPLDELDQHRIKGWKTLTAVRPTEEQESSSEEEGDVKLFFVPPGTALVAPTPKKTLQ